ncbi:7tm odorant receptor domain-containing protein [Phthorimaea operculella]|nr:7tm odorant receptor domain-containing protein [Phthorimaea operculella]
MYIANVLGDMDELSESSFLLFTQASLCYKTTVFLINKKNVKILIGLMEEDVFRPRNKVHVGMPVNPEYSPDYELGYFYQMIAIYISACLFCGVDSVALCTMMFGCAQLEIIGDKLLMVLTHRFPTCELLAIRSSLAPVLICMDRNYGGQVDPHSVQFSSMINYMMTMLSQLFLYCWCGQELTIRSERLRQWLYQCPWYEQDTKFRRSLWIAMARMSKPIIFRAGHYIPLSRPTFIQILRSSYSYFAVLNQAKNK